MIMMVFEERPLSKSVVRLCQRGISGFPPTRSRQGAAGKYISCNVSNPDWTGLSSLFVPRPGAIVHTFHSPLLSKRPQLQTVNLKVLDIKLG